MKKVILALLALAVVVGAVLVGWELVAKPGPLRKVWWKIKGVEPWVFEARLAIPLQAAIDEEQLANENRLLDKREILLPVIKDLKLVEAWELDGEWAAVERLASQSDFRMGENELQLLLAVWDEDKELAGRIIQPLAESFIRARSDAASAAPGWSVGGGR
jgi:hypothetical protein